MEINSAIDKHLKQICYIYSYIYTCNVHAHTHTQTHMRTPLSPKVYLRVADLVGRCAYCWSCLSEAMFLLV